MVQVLVLDNKGANTKLAKELLTPLGHQVIPVIGSSLALFLAHKNLPELILSDAESSDGTGFDFIRAVKSDPELSAIPFVFLVSQNDSSLEAQALKLGAEKFLKQPMKANELLQEIQPYLKERKSLRPPETPE
ncbi:MAG: response regulator [Candidatus Obscuribacterales bacterium]|nr:response regulator [Candidatus Obscuribacterales bacterium]